MLETQIPGYRDPDDPEDYVLSNLAVLAGFETNAEVAANLLPQSIWMNSTLLYENRTHQFHKDDCFANKDEFHSGFHWIKSLDQIRSGAGT